MTDPARTLHADNPMPACVVDALTDAEANEDTTSALWRWRALIHHIDLPGPTKAVAHVIAWHCKDRQRFCYPSTALLATESGFSRETVEAAVKELERRGLLLVWRDRWKTDGRRRNNTYAPAWPERLESTVGALCGARGNGASRARVPRVGEP